MGQLIPPRRATKRNVSLVKIRDRLRDEAAITANWGAPVTVAHIEPRPVVRPIRRTGGTRLVVVRTHSERQRARG